MHSLFSTWTGLFRYQDQKVPELQLTVTFKETGENTFCGYLSESPIILPKDFHLAVDVKGHQRLTPWGSIACDIFDGELLDHLTSYGEQCFHFEKISDQLSGYPVFCRGGFNAVAGTMNGIWAIMDVGSASDLPKGIKGGTFSLWKPQDDGNSAKTLNPIMPQLVVV